MIKIANIVGARPQFIKYYPVARAIQNTNESSGQNMQEILIHTGQHYDYTMSKVFFDELGIREPEYHLEVGSGSHGEQTGQVIKKMEKVLFQENPDVVVVYGDTNSTLGAAIAASKIHIPIAHVEAGLRSFNKHMPEEINRILTDHVSSLLFCPSKTAITHLRAEGLSNILNEGLRVPHNYFLQNKNTLKADIDKPAIINVGDVMYDVLLYALEIAKNKSTIMEQLDMEPDTYSLLTLHRAENTDKEEMFEEIISFINNISSGKPVIFPMHPRTRKVYENSIRKFSDNIRIIDPIGYFDILLLLKNAKLAMTDSGGMQKEAYWLKTPCITLREETEWVETVESGWNILFKNYNSAHNPSNKNALCYGDGNSAKGIVKALIRAFKK